MIEMYPIEFEAIDETGALLFRVKNFDEICSSVEIKTPVTPESWKELAAKVFEALEAMHKGEGK